MPDAPDPALRFDTFNGVPREWRAWLTKAADEIRVVHDNIDQALLAHAQQMLGGAEVICFLGFAYDSSILHRIGFPDSLSLRTHKPSIYGSCYGLRAGEQQWVRGRFNGQIELGTEKQMSREVLRELFVFRD